MIKGGLKPLEKDSRDFQLGGLIKWPKLSELPATYGIEPLSIKNQLADGNDDFCASCATTGMIEPKEEIELYYPYLFAAAKHASGDDVDSWGLSLRDVGKALQKYGVPEVRDVPATFNLTPSERRRFENFRVLDGSALKHRAKSYFFVKGPYEAYDDARAALWYFRGKKQQILFGVEWGWSLEDYELTGTPGGFGHALWISGWNEKGMIVVNSAGIEAGQGGTHLISRESFNQYAERFGMLMVIDLSPEEVKYYMDSGATLDDNWVVGIFKALFSVIKNLWPK